ncbi:hypothetical protein GEMRC1_013380 [Eukaryota sp. GEM-RC1]
MSDLGELVLSDKGLKSLSRFPPSLQGTSSLYLNRNRLTSCENLNYLPNITFLDLSENELVDIEDVVSLRFLKHLLLAHNKLSNITCLDYLHNLEYLDLSHNSLSSFTLSKSLKLSHLNLSSNSLSVFPSLAHLTHLSTLNLSSNPLPSVPASALPSSLSSLDLSKTSIASLGNLNGLASTTSLSTLFLSNTPIFLESLSKNFSLPCFCLFLCPSLRKFNNRKVSEIEVNQSQSLFCSSSGELDPLLLKLLLPAKKVELYRYLQEVCPPLDLSESHLPSSEVSQLWEVIAELQSEIENLKKSSLHATPNKSIDFPLTSVDISSVILIQAAIRGFLTRRRLFFIPKIAKKMTFWSSEVNRLESMVVSSKIVKIQALWRGFYVRKRLPNFKFFVSRRVAVQKEAVVVIQRAWRLKQCPIHSEYYNKISKIQAIIRGKLVRSKFEHRILIFRLKAQLHQIRN